MTEHRIVIYGNSGSGKTTMAKTLSRVMSVPVLDLDTIAWSAPVRRMELPQSLMLLDQFIEGRRSWIVEGSYGDLVAAAAVHCTELRFLNPGVETCVANARNRPWEPHKFASAQDQLDALDFLIQWIRQYEHRTDEFGLARHRAIFRVRRAEARVHRPAERGVVKVAWRRRDRPSATSWPNGDTTLG